MPGWTLTTVWFSPDGMPSDGQLQVRFFSGDGISMHGRRPDRYLRYMMHRLTLCPFFSLTMDASFIHTWFDPKLDTIEINEDALDAAQDFEEEEDDAESVNVKLQVIESIRRQLPRPTPESLTSLFGIADIHNHLREKTQVTWSYSSGR